MSCPCGCGKEVCAICNQAAPKCRCALRGVTHTCSKPRRAFIDTCTDCDPCETRESMMKICSFVVPTLEEGRYFRDSFVYNQEDDSVYYIDDTGTELAFGARPMFIEDFDPTERQIPRQVVYDFKNNKAHVFGPDGSHRSFNLTED